MKNNVPKDTEALILEAEKAYQKDQLINNKKNKESIGIYSVKEILEATKNIDPEIWKDTK